MSYAGYTQPQQQQQQQQQYQQQQPQYSQYAQYSQSPAPSQPPHQTHSQPQSLPPGDPDTLQFYQQDFPAAEAAAASGWQSWNQPSTAQHQQSQNYNQSLSEGPSRINTPDIFRPSFSQASSSSNAAQSSSFPLPLGLTPGFNLAAIKSAFGPGGFSDEPPLLEELGINFSHIKTKGLTVLNPLKPIDKHIMDDTDLAGPLVFCFAFGFFLVFSGKLQFGYIYGLSFLGVVGTYTLLNLLSPTGIDVWRTASVLGYCLLPMVLLSGVCFGFNVGSYFTLSLAALSVLWCTHAASSIFTTVLSMHQQRLLVAYPVGLLYSLFAILAIY